MLTNIILLLVTWFIKLVSFLLPTYQAISSNFASGLSYFFSTLATLNFFFPIDQLFTALLYLINFEIAYYSVKLVVKIVNFVRGSGELKI